MNKKIFFFVFLALLIGLLGCSKKECSKNTDCSAGSCFSAKCTKGICENTPKLNCCGNEKCESGENKCSCASDCGACTGSKGKYLKMTCVEKECVADLSNETTEKSLTDIIDISSSFRLSATYTYPQPFNLDKSLFNIKIRLETIQQDISKPKITKVQLFRKLDNTGKEIKVLGEADINQVLWSTESLINQDIIFRFVKLNSTDETIKTFVKIFYEFTRSNSGRDQITPGTYEKEIKDPIIVVKPETKKKCPDSCDDENFCTTDSCNPNTDYFCVHIIKKGACCGNHLCDENENECTCGEDCGKCERFVGNFLEYVCENSQCLRTIRNPNLIKPITSTQDQKFTYSSSYFTLQVKNNYKSPFNVNSDKFQMNFELIDITPGVKNIKFTRVQVLDGTTRLLKEIDLSDTVVLVGSSFAVDIPITFDKPNFEEEDIKNINIKYYFEWTAPPQNEKDIPHDLKNQQITWSYGQVVFINPVI